MFYAHRGFSLNPQDMDELAETYSRSLRDGTKDLIKQTYDLSIPVLVFSAGLGTPKMLSFMF